MKLHPKLEPFEEIKNIKKIHKLLQYIEKDLETVGVHDFDVDVWEKERPKSALKRMLTFEEETEPHQVLFVSGVYQSYPFSASMPMRNARSMPYTIEIELPVRVDFVANYVPALIQGKWKVIEGPEGVKERLKGFEMPGIVWKHSAGGYNYKIKIASIVAPSEEDETHTNWMIKSGYHGAVVNVGPRISSYVQAAQKLEMVLISS